VGFVPYRKTNPQNGEHHKGDPGRQQMKGCRNHHNYSDPQDDVGPLDVIFGEHDTCRLCTDAFPPLAIPLRRLALSGRSDF
jgi:hypothetical protein